MSIPDMYFHKVEHGVEQKHFLAEMCIKHAMTTPQITPMCLLKWLHLMPEGIPN